MNTLTNNIRNLECALDNARRNLDHWTDELLSAQFAQKEALKAFQICQEALDAEIERVYGD